IFIIDRQLQNSDGLDVCRFLKNREQFACTPVILFSAGGKLHEMAKKAGADDFIEKPFTIKSLLQMIEKYVGKYFRNKRIPLLKLFYNSSHIFFVIQIIQPTFALPK